MTKAVDLSHRIFELCARVRKKRPLIHVVTNFVVMNQTANALLALGAAPTMSWAKEDVEYMSAVSDGLCVNMGTPVTKRIEVIKDLMSLGEKMGKPIVLDPVGSGAGPYRTGIARELLLLAPHKIIRGNASEICSLLGQDHTTKGVENTLALKEAKQILIGHGRTHGTGAKIADGKTMGAVNTKPNVSSILQFACAVIVSGQKDLILGQNKSITLGNGALLMNDVTGTGCILSAVTAAFYAVCDNGFEAAVAATSVVGIAGELAAKKAAGPGTFMAHFLDSLYAIDQETIQRRLKAEFNGEKV